MGYLTRNPNAERADILTQVASGLAYLHTADFVKPVIIHGDLHPGNILITTDKRAVVCDFGLCHVVPDGHLASLSFRPDQMPRGRTAYIAPELYEADVRRSASSDVYSFGILAWELYAGQAPFADRAAGAMASMLQLAKGERPMRCEVQRGDFTDVIWSLVKDCWAHEGAGRPSMLVARRRLTASVVPTTNVDDPRHTPGPVPLSIHARAEVSDHMCPNPAPRDVPEDLGPKAPCVSPPVGFFARFRKFFFG
ncbi:kinase-like protein [Exidia glandulosa HHB12029]|uniref:Kinase-like protein n=1 Tax=Exidia glandulosa HHB12029 TaxID=1314781 RepID=A0A165KZ13_EXIGL|nr:kinase-like protein [Exidia glandulosa HHB12029]